MPPKTTTAPAIPAEGAGAMHEAADETNTGLARATTILAIGNISSRVLGFAKEIILSNVFGAGRAVDAFQIAITIPQDLYDLAIFGHTNSALVPVLTEYAAKEGGNRAADNAELWRLVSTLSTLVMLITGLFALLMAAFAPAAITFYRGAPAPGLFSEALRLTPALLERGATALTPEAFNLSVNLLQLTAPALVFMSLYSVLSGALLSLRRFVWPAFGAALFNGVIVVATLALAPQIGIQAAAVGWVLGALAQLVLQLGGLRRAGARLRLVVVGLPQAIRHPGIRRIALLYVPVLLTLVVDVLINRPFSYNVASRTGEGNIAYMNWATSLREFPMGLVGTAISIAILPTLARQALFLRESAEGRAAFRATLGQGVRLALTLIIPATVGMFVLAGPLIGLVYERGAFTAEDTNALSIVLRLYLLGIPFAAIDLILIFAFYAQRDSLTPALVGMFSLGCYIAITLALLPAIGFLSLMVADSAKHLIHMLVSYALLRRKVAGLGDQRLPVTLLKVVLATAVMGLVTYALARSIAEIMPAQGLRERLLLVIGPAALGGATYLVLASLLRLNEMALFLRALTRRIGR
jgi:putative peptidoglycan lipid II flippase